MSLTVLRIILGENLYIFQFLVIAAAGKAMQIIQNQFNDSFVVHLLTLHYILRVAPVLDYFYFVIFFALDYLGQIKNEFLLALPGILKFRTEGIIDFTAQSNRIGILLNPVILEEQLKMEIRRLKSGQLLC